MTKKDYILLVEALKRSKPDPSFKTPNQRAKIDQFRDTVHSVNTALQADNPRFDPAKFLKAVHS